MNIILCDDEKIIHEEFDNLINRYKNSYDEEISVQHFYNRNDLIKSTKEGYDNTIYFLDMEFPDDNGIDIAREIQKISKQNSIIIFLTSYPKYMLESFEIHPFTYLMKPLGFEDFEKVLSKVKAEVKEKEDFEILVKDKETTYFLCRNNITYIETNPNILSKGVLFHTNDGSVYADKRQLSFWEKELADKAFIRPHQSFLVNLQHINYCTNTSIIMKDETEIVISRRKVAEIKSMFARNAVIKI